MYKAFIFMLSVLLFAVIGSVAVIAVCVAVGFVKDFIDDWRE